MKVIFELYYETQDGDVVFCSELDSELEAINDVTQLSIEFPEHQYYEVVYE